MARVPGSSSSKRSSTTKATSTAKSAKGAATSKSSTGAGIRKPKTPKNVISPTVINQESLSIKIPHTEAGRVFLAKLQGLLHTTKLPFTRVCSPGQIPTGHGTGNNSSDDGSTYALEIRLEQEGWP